MCVTIFLKDFHYFNNHEALLSLTSKPLDFKQPPPPTSTNTTTTFE